MPYMLKGTTIMVKKGGQWQALKRHKTRAQALAHLRALKANVKK